MISEKQSIKVLTVIPGISNSHEYSVKLLITILLNQTAYEKN
jgi:hypothetical protein